MRRTILAQANRIVGEDINSALSHKRRHSNRVSRVLHEDEEGATIGNETPVEGNAIHHRCHGEFSNAVINVVALGIGRVGTHSTWPQGKV